MTRYGRRAWLYGNGNSKIKTTMATSELKVVTYNCHGLNQGTPYLKDLLLLNDIVCIQEHWLSRKDLSKLTDLSNDFEVIASFAVDSALDSGILRGRPYGGLAIFIRVSLKAKIKYICKSDRLLVIQINDLLLCNVYMPCDDSEMFSSILGSISDYIANRNDNVDHYIVLGDFNCSYLIPNQLFDVFHCFTTECELKNVL